MPTLGISFPYILFHTGGRQTLHLTMSGSTLRVLGIEGLGDMVVGPETIAAFNQAVAGKLP
jgi:hypothetical protein